MEQVKSMPLTADRIKFDPRTKLLLCITIPAILISGKDVGLLLYIKGVISIIPVLLFVASKQYGWAIKCGLIFITAYIMQLFVMPNTTGSNSR